MNDFDRRAEGGQRVNFQNIEGLDAPDTAVGVLLQQRLENGPCLLAILGEDMALLHAIGSFAAGQGRLVEGDMADEVEGVIVATNLLGKFVEENPLTGKLFDNGLLSLSAVPGVKKVVE